MSGADQPPLQARLAALREPAAKRQDPVRCDFLEALAQRMAGQPPAVQLLLRGKLEAGLAAFAETPPLRARSGRAQPPASPLGRLLAEVAAARQGAGEPADELASVRRFRQAWLREHTASQVAQAVARRPANAGPLNSHALVLQAMELMRDLSPDYLRQFVLQVETLLWLDSAVQAPARTPVKVAKGARPRGRKKGSPGA